MRIGRSFRDGVLTFAEPRSNRVRPITFAAADRASRSVASAYTSELLLKQTIGFFDEAGVNNELGGVSSAGDWTGADPTS